VTPGCTRSNSTTTGHNLHKHGGDIIIFTKSGREFTSRFPGIREALVTLPCRSAIIDAEIVALAGDGTADFPALHSGNYAQGRSAPSASI